MCVKDWVPSPVDVPRHWISSCDINVELVKAALISIHLFLWDARRELIAKQISNHFLTSINVCRKIGQNCKLAPLVRCILRLGTLLLLQANTFPIPIDILIIVAVDFV